MRLNYQSRLAATILAVALTVASAGAWPRRQGENVRVRFLATSTFFRTTRGPNEDIYLAELKFQKSGEEVLVRLIDAYPNQFAPLARAVLLSDSGTMLTVKRDMECDRQFGQILLRTAPGDPMAILPERLGYRPPLQRTPAPGAVLPCYRVLRR